jgi:hypothetical protein
MKTLAIIFKQVLLKLKIIKPFNNGDLLLKYFPLGHITEEDIFLINSSDPVVYKED